MKKFIFALLISGSFHAVYALPPSIPESRLQQSILENGTTLLELKWDQVDFADGYLLLYADYPHFHNINTLDVGQTFGFKTTLSANSAYWVTIAAYNQDGMSSVSTIHPVVIPTEARLLMPRVTQKQEGHELLLSWEGVPDATGYKIRYGKQADLSQATTVEIRNTQYRLPWENGQTYFVGVTAHNATQTSLMALSFHQDRRRIVALIHQEIERQGLQDGRQRFQKQWQKLPLEILRWDSLENLTAQLEGSKVSEGQGNRRGLLNDQEIVALVTTTTDSTLRVIQNQAAQNLLTVAMLAPSTLLKQSNNLLQISASHAQQASTLHNFLEQRAQTRKQMNRYVILIEAEAKKLPEHFDLYLNILKNSFDVETAAPLLPSNSPFSQLLATFSLEGEASIARIGTAVALLKPDTVLYLGSAERFRQLYAAIAVPAWLLSDSGESLIQSETTLDAVTVATLGSPGQIVGQAPYFSAYDTVGLLGQLLSDSDVSRATLLNAARRLDQKPYSGITGRKSFVETDETGWYDLFTYTTQGGWQRNNYQ